MSARSSSVRRRAALAGLVLAVPAVFVAPLVVPAPVFAAGGGLVISEFRLRGPNGANDEFIEIANVGSTAHTVSATAGTGYGVAASDGVTRCSIPNGTIIPRAGHFLCVNSVGYSLASYPAGNGTTATGDVTYTTDIADNAGIALFDNNVGGASYALARRIDAVGSTGEANALYREGAGYPSLTPFSINYSFVRNLTTGAITATGVDSLATAGAPQDTDDNGDDFIFVDTNGTSAGAGQRLGAPGPENLSSPVAGVNLTVSPLDPCVSESSPPNVVRDFTSDPANNSTFGTLDVRRTITNNTASSVTRLRFRVADIRTFPAPSGVADLRPRTSNAVVVTVDRAPCGQGTSNVLVTGTSLEQPPAQPNGGAFNSTMGVGAVTLGAPLAPGASIDVRLLFGYQQTGTDTIRIIAEALPAFAGPGSPAFFCLGGTSSNCDAPVANTDIHTTREDTPLVVAAPGLLANDTDAGMDPMIVVRSSVTAPAHGTAAVNANGSFTYTPSAGYSGPDSFTYIASDRTGASGRATVNITVTPRAEVPVGASRFVPLTPSRVFDTRPGEPAAGPKGALPSGGSIDVKVTGVAGIPSSGVSAVVLNVAATDTAEPGFVTMWPAGTAQPLASSLNLTAAAQTRANLVTVPVGAGGRVSVYSHGGGHLLADVAGYFTPIDDAVRSGRLVPLTPTRVFDTRPEAAEPGPKGFVAAGRPIVTQIAGVGGVPTSGVSAVVMNVTATQAAGPGFVSAFPTGVGEPLASIINLNAANETAPNLVIVPLGSGGTVTFLASSGAHLLADVTGYFTDSSAAASTSGVFVPLAPDRVFDTRPDEPAAGPKGVVQAGTSIATQIAGVGLIPSGAAAVVLNVTGVNSHADGFVTSWPPHRPQPVASTLNLAPGDTRANAAILPLSPSGQLAHFALAPVDLLADSSGYFTP